MNYAEPRWQQRFKHATDAVGASKLLLLPEVLEEFTLALYVPAGVTVSARMEFTIASHTEIQKAVEAGGTAINDNIIWFPWTTGDVAQGINEYEWLEMPISAVRAYVAVAEAGLQITWEILGNRAGIQPIKLI